MRVPASSGSGENSSWWSLPGRVYEETEITLQLLMSPQSYLIRVLPSWPRFKLNYFWKTGSLAMVTLGVRAST